VILTNVLNNFAARFNFMPENVFACATGRFIPAFALDALKAKCCRNNATYGNIFCYTLGFTSKWRAENLSDRFFSMCIWVFTQKVKYPTIFWSPSINVQLDCVSSSNYYMLVRVNLFLWMYIDMITLLFLIALSGSASVTYLFVRHTAHLRQTNSAAGFCFLPMDHSRLQ